MLKTININTSIDTVFKQYLTIVNIVLSKDTRLTNIELDVLSKMLYIDYLYRHLDKEKRDTIIFHRETKVRIRESLQNMSDNSYKNVIVKLKKKGFIDNKSLKVKIPVVDNEMNIQFKLNIETNATTD